MKIFGRRVLHSNDTASIIADQLPLPEAIEHHAYMRIQQLAVDLFAVFGRASSGRFRTQSAKLQGIRCKDGMQGSHNSLNAGITDDVLKTLRVKLIEDENLSPKSQKLLKQVYGLSPNTAKEKVRTVSETIGEQDSLLWADRKKDRHHCMGLPSWVNQVIDRRMETKFRSITEEYYSAALTGKMQIEEILLELVPKIEEYFLQASATSLEMAELLEQVTLSEIAFIDLANVYANNEEFSVEQYQKTCDLLYQIIGLKFLIGQRRESVPRTKVSSPLNRLLRLLPKEKPCEVEIVEELMRKVLDRYKIDFTHPKAARNRGAVWSLRYKRIEYYKQLQTGNIQSAKGTKIPPLDYLIPKTPETKERIRDRLIRKPGLMSPYSSVTSSSVKHEEVAQSSSSVKDEEVPHSSSSVKHEEPLQSSSSVQILRKTKKLKFDV